MTDGTPAVQLAWQIAAMEADGAGHEKIERGHLLIGLLSIEKLCAAPPSEPPIDPRALASARAEAAQIDAVLRRAKTSTAALRRQARRALGTGPRARRGGTMSRSEASKLAFVRAAEISHGTPLRALHLLTALVLEPDAALAEVLRACAVDASWLSRAALDAVRAATPDAPEGGVDGSAPAKPVPPPKAVPWLDRFGRDLTRLARDGTLGPVIGRRDVLLDIIQTLARSTKMNPLLVGEAGVGKTALVEALAIRAAQGKDAAVLGGKRIVELSVGALLGGTQYRGELEERLTGIVEEAAAHPEVIVFIDELHTIVGAGRTGTSGADAASLLKPALARGDFRCIGATTPGEYRRFIEPDAALTRRFELITVPEPSRDECLAILRGLVPRWEKHHGLRIDPASLEAAVDLSVRFDTERYLPDKAVDLVDKAAARVRVPNLSTSAAGASAPPGDRSVPATPESVTALDVAMALADARGLPLDLVRAGTAERLLALEAFLRGRLVGQDEATLRVSQRLRVAHAGLQQRRGPLAVFLFLGPTGVGKTETARLLAEFLFGNRTEMTRLDMSELMEEHSVAKLIGAPPGYVGHDEDGQLTLALRSRPYSVVLLDEVEKAHPRILDLFLQLFDEGRLTDAKGRTADGRHAIFAMTSNLGGGEARAPMGFATGPSAPRAADTALDEARRFFRPELLARIDEAIVFQPLDREAIRRIARPMLAAVSEAVRRQHGVELVVSDEAEDFIAEAGFSPTQGARGMTRTVERLVHEPLSTLVLSGELARHPTWRVVCEAGGVSIVAG